MNVHTSVRVHLHELCMGSSMAAAITEVLADNNFWQTHLTRDLRNVQPEKPQQKRPAPFSAAQPPPKFLRKSGPGAPPRGQHSALPYPPADAQAYNQRLDTLIRDVQSTD